MGRDVALPLGNGGGAVRRLASAAGRDGKPCGDQGHFTRAHFKSHSGAEHRHASAARRTRRVFWWSWAFRSRANGTSNTDVAVVAKSVGEARLPRVAKYSGTQVTEVPVPQFQEEIVEVTQLISAKRTPNYRADRRRAAAARREGVAPWWWW